MAMIVPIVHPIEAPNDERRSRLGGSHKPQPLGLGAGEEALGVEVGPCGLPPCQPGLPYRPMELLGGEGAILGEVEPAAGGAASGFDFCVIAYNSSGQTIWPSSGSAGTRWLRRLADSESVRARVGLDVR